MPSSRKPNKAKRPRSRTHLKKHKDMTSLDQTQASPCSTVSSTTSSCLSSTSASRDEDLNNNDNSPLSPSGGGGGCCTPKAQKCRIPEVLTCPPAPKKQRVVPNCTIRRRPIAFFAPPDIELFFVIALDEHVN